MASVLVKAAEEARDNCLHLTQRVVGGGAEEKRNCLALLVLVSLLWTSEALQLYVTSLLVPGLAVVLVGMLDRSDPKHPRRLTPEEASPVVFHAMFSQVGTPVAPAKSVGHQAPWDRLIAPSQL